MTPTQDRALWELCRQGLHRIAEDAEAAWRDGHRFNPAREWPVAREIRNLIERCNWEIGSGRYSEPA